MFKKLLNWSLKNHSDLPWRKERTLYTTLVSEIMLQQTTVGTVLNRYSDFLKTFPTIYDLAKASEEELAIAWKGLGYYRRARNLLKASKEIVQNYNGEIPTKYEDLVSIPGIGEYTANALIAIGHNNPALALDANLKRVLSRIFAVSAETEKELKAKLNELNLGSSLKKNSRDLNEAFMDLGREICRARKASCLVCPMVNSCQAYQENNPLAYPGLKEQRKKKFDLKLLRFVVMKKNKILMYQKKKKEWLTDQWELPTFVMKTTKENFQQYPAEEIDYQADGMIKSGITDYKIENDFIILTEKEWKELGVKNGREKWRLIDSRNGNFSTITRKILKKTKIESKPGSV